VTTAKNAEKLEAKIAERKERMEMAVDIRRERRQKIIDHREHREKYYGKVRAERMHKVMLQKLESDLEETARLENVARISRLDDFKRLQMLQKVQKDDERSAQIKATRADLVEKRKQNAHDSFMRKHRIREAMEQMKITNKVINLDNIIDGPGKKKALEE